MSGGSASHSDKLEGWTIAKLGNHADHTYVISSCGLRWGCWGRDHGGHHLRGAIGSSIIADCISQPKSQAGIKWHGGDWGLPSNRQSEDGECDRAGADGRRL